MGEKLFPCNLSSGYISNRGDTTNNSFVYANYNTVASRVWLNAENRFLIVELGNIVCNKLTNYIRRVKGRNTILIATEVVIVIIGNAMPERDEVVIHHA